MTTESLAQMNTCICYKYRDGANYKFPGTVVLEGPITDEQIRPYLHEALYFIPGDVGLPISHPTHCEFDEDLDHPWHELDSVQPTQPANRPGRAGFDRRQHHSQLSRNT